MQRADLEKSLDELEKLRDDLTKTVETRFAETFAAVEHHFHEVAATLFPGGEGRLRMTEAEDDDGEEPGIEVELRPAGKRVTRLSLLSGGEKALGAIAFLFSLFLARPEPVLPARRGRGRARRHEHRPLHRAPAHVRRPRAVHRDHAPEAHDGSGGRPLRRDDGHRTASRRSSRGACRATRRSQRPRERPRASSCAPSTCCRRAGSRPGCSVAGARSCEGCARRASTPISTCSTRRVTGSASTQLQLDWVDSKRFPWKRAFMLEGTLVELFLVERDDHGWFTQLARRRHDWPDNRLLDQRPRSESHRPLRSWATARPSAARRSAPANLARAWREAGQSCWARRTRAPRPTRSAAVSSAACASRSASRGARSPSRSSVAAFDPEDDASWERLEEALIYADVGVRATAELIRRLEARQDLTELASALAEEIAALFGEPRDARRRARACGDPRRRRQRHRQDDDDRQAREEAARARAPGDARRGRHVPRGGGGAARDLGASARAPASSAASAAVTRRRSPTTRSAPSTASCSSTPRVACTRRRT